MSWTKSTQFSFPPLSQRRIRFPLHRLIHPCGNPVDHLCLFHCPSYQKWAVPAIPHFTNERITVSFSRHEVSCHALPTHFVKSTRRSPALTFPLINSSGFADKCSVARLSTLIKFCIECNVEWFNLARCTWKYKPQCRLALASKWSLSCLLFELCANHR